MERIRYINNGGILTSMRTLTHPDNGAQYTAEINLTDFSWLIRDANHKHLVVVSGVAARRTQAQNRVKDALIELGVGVTREKREPYRVK
jgi:hypothetical protein